MSVDYADGDAPEDLLTVARRAIESGAVRVDVRREHFDRYLTHPFEWSLRVTMLDRGTSVSLNRQPGLPTRMRIAGETVSHVDEAFAWIARCSEDGDAVTEAEQQGFRMDADIMTAAFRQGWSVSRRRGPGELVELDFAAIRYGTAHAQRTISLTRIMNATTYTNASDTNALAQETPNPFPAGIVPVDDALQVVSARAPWFVPVVAIDDGDFDG